MKKYILTLAVLFCCIWDVQGAALIFKAEATVEQGEKHVVLGSFDASKYRQIRIAVIATINADQRIVSKTDAKLRLEMAQRTLKSNEDLFQKGLISKSDYDRYADDVRKAQDDLNRAEDIAGTSAEVYGFEGTDLIWLAGTANEKGFSFSNVIDSPPPRVTVKVGGRGVYRLYVWGL